MARPKKVDNEDMKLFSVRYKNLPQRIYRTLTEREAIMSYRHDLLLSPSRPDESFVVSEYKTGEEIS